MYFLEPEEFRFVPRPYLTCPTAMVLMAKEKSGKTTAVSNVPKMQVCQWDRSAVKVDVPNIVDMKLYEYLDKETYDKIKIGPKGNPPNIKPKFYHTDKLNDLGFHVPPSVYDLALEAKPDVKIYKDKVKALKCAEALRDQKVYDAALEDLRDFVCNKMTCPIMVIDNLTSLMAEVYTCALKDYEKANPKADKKANIKVVDTYGGSRFIRMSLQNISTFIYENFAPIVIFVGHMAPKIVNKDNTEMTSNDLDVEGKLGPIFTTSVDTVGILHRKEGDGIYISFKKDSDDQSLGSRSIYLDGKDIKIADWVKEGENPVNVNKYWEAIFPEIYGK